MSDVHSQVQDYYGKQLKTSADLKTDACKTTTSYTTDIKKIIGQIHDEVVSKYYGCGLTIPDALAGLKVLEERQRR